MRSSRRQLLQWVGASGAASMLPGCKHGGDDASASPSSGFFTDDERSSLAALADVVIPPGPGPGGAQLGAVVFIERLCSAFDAPVPTIFAGGPYSGRQPFASPAGERSGVVPGNDFATFLPLDRATERAWRLELYGSAGVPGGGPNDAISGPIVGLRDKLKQGLAAVTQGLSGPLASMSADDVASVFASLDVDFRDLLIELITEATFSAPEYGGNVGLGGWKLARYEGDMLPLGFSQFSSAGYKELPGMAVAGPNALPDPAPMDSATLDFARAVVGFLGGKERP